MKAREAIPVVEKIAAAVVPSHNLFLLMVDKDHTDFNGEWLYVRLKMNKAYLKKIYYYIAGEGETVDLRRLEEAIRSGKMAVSCLSVDEYGRNQGIAFRRNRLHGKGSIYIAGEFERPETGIQYVFAAPWSFDNSPKRVIQYELLWEQAGPPWRRHSVRSNCTLRIRCESGDTPRLNLAYCHDRDIPGNPEALGTEIIYSVPARREGYPNGKYEVLLDDSLWKEMENGTQLRLLAASQEPRFDIQPLNSVALKVPDKEIEY